MNSPVRYWLRGAVTAEVKGQKPEALYNACMGAGIPVYLVRRREGRTELTIPADAYIRLRHLASAFSLRIRCIEKRGLPFWLRPYRKRWGFLAGIGLFFLLLFSLGSLTWVVEVEGNSRCSAEKICSASAENGIAPGKKLPSDQLSFAEQKTLLQLPELSWMAFNRAGSRMRICVTERAVPELIQDCSKPGHLLAETDGLLVFCDVFRGRPCLQVGQPFCKGDVLVSGYLYGTHSAQSIHASAELLASVRRSYVLRMEKSGAAFQKTGKKEAGVSCILFGKELRLGPRQPSFAKSEHVYRERTLSFFGLRLPIACRADVWREQKKVRQTRSTAALRAEGLLRMEEKIRQELGEKGQLQEIHWSLSEDSDSVTLRAETQLLLPVGVFCETEVVPPPLSPSQKEE